MLKKQHFQRLVAALLIPFLLGLPGGLHAEALSVSAAQNSPKDLRESLKVFDLPPELGRVEKVFLPDARDALKSGVVFLIQDAHAQPEAQRSIQGILQYLETQWGLRHVFLEGGQGFLDPVYFQSFPDEEKKRRIVEGYLQAGELSGAEAALILGEERETVYFGIEDHEVYKKNKTAYLTGMTRQGTLQTLLQQRETEIFEEARKNGSANLLRYLNAKKALLDQKNSTALLSSLKEFHTLALTSQAAPLTPASFQTKFPEIESILETLRQESLKLSPQQDAELT